MIKLIGDYVLDTDSQKFVIKKGQELVVQTDDLMEAIQAATDNIVRQTIAGNVNFSKEETKNYTEIVEDLTTMYNHCYELFKGIATGGKENG